MAAAGLAQLQVAFEDVALYFTREQWELLSQPEKQLYRDQMLRNYWVLISLGYSGSTPHLIHQIEVGEAELWIRDAENSRESSGPESPSRAAHFSVLPTPSGRLAKRRRRKRTRDEMFSEIMEVSHSDRAHQNDWKEVIAKYRKDASDREDRRDTREERWRQEEERWQQEDRQEDQRCRQEDQRWRDAMLELLRDQTEILRRMVDVQEQQRGYRVPLQPMFNHPQSSPHSISPSPRRVRTRGGRISAPTHSSPYGHPNQKADIKLKRA